MGQINALPKSIVSQITGVSGKQNKAVIWHTAKIILKPLLSWKEYMETVYAILDDCRAPDGTIAFELLDFAERLHIIMAYAFVELPEDMEQLYYIIYSSDLYETVVKYVNGAQVNSIRNAVREYAAGKRT